MVKLFCINKKNYLLFPVLSEYNHLPDNFNSHLHFHKVYHVVFVLEGNGLIENDCGDISLTAGDIFIINPSEKHVFKTKNDSLYYFALNFYLIPLNGNEDAEEILSDHKSLEGFDVETKKFHELFNLKTIKSKNSFLDYNHEYFSSIKHDIAGFRGGLDVFSVNFTNKKSYASKCLDFLAGLISSYFSDDKPDINPEYCHDIIIKKIIGYIDNNLEKKLSLNEISKTLGYNPTYLSSYFSNKTKIKMSEFHNMKRLYKAALYLKNTKISITDIALGLGFSSSQHFCTAFKVYKGISPRDYRNNIELY